MNNSSRLQRALFALLRSGLWERAIDDSSAFPLTADEWKQLYGVAKQQTVLGIVYQGLQHLPQDMLPPMPLLVRWTAVADAIERRNREVDSALSSLCALFRSQGIDPVLQKGQGVAQLYENPLLRECGDIDLFLGSKSAMETANSCIRNHNIRVEAMPDDSFTYTWQGVEVEHHSRLLDLHNPFLQGYARRLERAYGYDAVELPSRQGQQIAVASPFLNLLLLDLHILKHALGWGIGLRQLCDMARACHAYSGKIDKTQMQRSCHRMGMRRWNPLLHAFLVNYLGLPVEYLPYPKVAKDAVPLLNIVWQGGNFGFGFRQGKAPAQGTWKRKLRTAGSFCSKVPFVVRYAPKEAFWIFTGLLKGQM